MQKIKNFFIVDGYNPFGIANLILGAVGALPLTFIMAIVYTQDMDFSDIIWIFKDADTEQISLGALAFCLIWPCIFLFILIIRNRKLHNTIKNIIFSVLTVLLGGVLSALAFVLFMLMIIFGGAPASAVKKVANASQSSNTNNDTAQNNSFSKQDDVNAQMLGYANAQQYQDLTGYDGHNINPDDEYLRAK